MHIGIRIGLHVEAVTILHAGVEPFHENMPYLPGAVGAWIESELDKGMLRSRLQENQRARRRVLREDGKVDPSAAQGCAQGKRNSAVDAITSDRSRGRFLGLTPGKRFWWHA